MPLDIPSRSRVGALQGGVAFEVPRGIGEDNAEVLDRQTSDQRITVFQRK
jgi:hypothetical protein